MCVGGKLVLCDSESQTNQTEEKSEILGERGRGGGREGRGAGSLINSSLKGEGSNAICLFP